VCYAKGWEREHEGGECLCRRRALHCVGCARLSASGLAQNVAEGDSPSAEGVEGHEVKGPCVLLQQWHICLAHCSRHMHPLAWGRGRPLAGGSELEKGW